LKKTGVFINNSGARQGAGSLKKSPLPDPGHQGPPEPAFLPGKAPAGAVAGALPGPGCRRRPGWLAPSPGTRQQFYSPAIFRGWRL